MFNPFSSLAPNGLTGNVGAFFLLATGISLDSAASASPLSLWAGQTVLVGAADGGASAASFCHPTAVATDTAGNAYVADTANSTIRRIAPDGTVSTLAGQAGVPGATDGSGAAASFCLPEGVTAGPNGMLYVADTGNCTIRQISPTGVVTTLAGQAGAPGTADGTGAAARFNRPEGLALDSAGNLYVADTGSNTIRMIAPAGAVSTLAGAAGFAGSVDGLPGAARFNRPRGLALNEAGILYVADSGNDTVRSVALDGVVSTLAGQPGMPGNADGVGQGAQFSGPAAVAVDGAGNIFVADRDNGALREISPDGAVTTLAAPGLCAPSGLAINSTGNLYLVDTYNDVIRLASAYVGAGVALPTAGPGATPASAGSAAAGSSSSSTASAGTTSESEATTGTSDGSVNTGSAATLTTAAGSGTTGSTVSAASSTARFANLSVRAEAGSGSNSLIVGFVIAGSGDKSVLLRAIGPTLARFGVTGAIASPHIALYESGSDLDAAGAWGGSAYLAQIFAATGAFALPTQSADAACAESLSAGAYSAQITGANGAPGIALGEIYDADPVSASSRLTNLSVRAFIGASGGVIAGFVITGNAPETVLIRAIGPGLAPLGVAGVLPQPELILTDSAGSVIRTNAAWSGDPALSQAFAAVGAFALDPASDDAALLVSLPPGSYGAQIQAVAGTSGGIGLIEVYEVR